MIIKIIVGILVYFIGMGVISAIAEAMTGDILWGEDLLHIFFLAVWPLSVPVFFLFSLGQYLVWTILFIFDKEKKD